MKLLQKFGKCSYQNNVTITSNKLFSSDMMSEINLKGNCQKNIITEQKYETFTTVLKTQLKRQCQNYTE